MATAATISTVAFPAMINRGYHRNFTLGILAAGGTLGILIPPSIPMIVYAFVVEESVLSMFLAGIGPGIVLALFFIIFSVFYVKFFNKEVQNVSSTLEEKLNTQKRFANIINGLHYAGWNLCWNLYTNRSRWYWFFNIIYLCCG